jgi:acetylornithine deacetylase
MVTRLFTAPWGMQEPIGYPETCKVQLYWQTMPGEEPERVQAEFDSWLSELVDSAPEVFTTRPMVESPMRWLPGSAISKEDPLVKEFSECAAECLGKMPQVVGIEAPCDMYVFHQFGIPAILWGPTGGNTHSADEYVEIDSLVQSARVLLQFVCRWCGVG